MRDGLGPRLLFSSSAFSPSTPLWEPVLPRSETVAGQHPVHFPKPQKQLTFMVKFVLTTKAIDDRFLYIYDGARRDSTRIHRIPGAGRFQTHIP